MMLRLSLAARITTIIVVSLAAIWIVVVTLHVYGKSGQVGSAWPAAEQVAAIALLVERTPVADRDLALKAVTSDSLRARLDPVKADEKPDYADRVGETLAAPYAAALDRRPVTVLVANLSGERKGMNWLLSGGINALEFRIRLRDDTGLVIDTRGAVAINRLGLPVGLGAGLLATLVALVTLIILHRETQPLTRLAAAVDQMDLSRDPTPLATPGASAPEIRALVAAFNRLQDRLKTLLLARMAMLGGISHDVRTFATRLRLRIEGIPDADERERADQDIADMIRLLDDALLTSRAGAGELDLELVDFDDLLRREVEGRRALGGRVDLAAPVPAALLLGDRIALRRIVSNLIDNAIAYGNVAHVTLFVTAREAELVVDDEGPGIPDHARATMLEPFTRAEGSRNRQTGGAGLGLAIVQSLVEAHGGRVTIGQANGSGARFRVILPIYGSPSRLS